MIGIKSYKFALPIWKTRYHHTAVSDWKSYFNILIFESKSSINYQPVDPNYTFNSLGSVSKFDPTTCAFQQPFTFFPFVSLTRRE